MDGVKDTDKLSYHFEAGFNHIWDVAISEELTGLRGVAIGVVKRDNFDVTTWFPFFSWGSR